eukprot:4329617-Pleurochrysis_carterae.AAC.1
MPHQTLYSGQLRPRLRPLPPSLQQRMLWLASASLPPPLAPCPLSKARPARSPAQQFGLRRTPAPSTKPSSRATQSPRCPP